MLRAAIEEWVNQRENVEDCSCADADPNGACWYHLSPEERRKARIQSFTEMLEREDDLL